MGCMSPSRAWAARARMAARAGSGGASNGPKSARLTTRPGSDAARWVATIVPMECATTWARSIPTRSMTRRVLSRNSPSERGPSGRGERPDPGRSRRMVRWRAKAASTGVKVLDVPPRPWSIMTGSPSPSISTTMRSTSTRTLPDAAPRHRLRRQSQKGGSYYRTVKKAARPFYALPDLGSGHRGRVFRRLLDEAVRLVRRGRIPSVAEVAQTAGVSRATAYRYFPSRSKLVSAVIAEALGPVRRAVPQRGDAKQRLHELLDRTYSRFAEYEPHMRAALQLALEHQSLESVGLLEEEPFRRGQRTEILATTLEPLRRRLKPRAYRRLLKALAVVYGIEPMIILKDICKATDHETEAVVRWMMDALVDAALREARTGSEPAGRDSSRRRVVRAVEDVGRSSAWPRGRPRTL